MPRISFFYGIAIYMYVDDHGVPHFHARYAGKDVSVEISTTRVLGGNIPPAALKQVLEWAELRREELQRDWELAKALEPLENIPPLP